MSAATLTIQVFVLPKIFQLSKYAKVAYAAIERHRIEAPFRAKFREAFPNKKCTMAFGHLLLRLNEKGLIDIKATRPLERRYHRLSKLIHG